MGHDDSPLKEYEQFILHVGAGLEVDQESLNPKSDLLCRRLQSFSENLDNWH